MKVRYLPRAFADLEAIYSFVAKQDPNAALRITGAIRQSIGALAVFPEIGQVVEDSDVRLLRSSHQSYNIYYVLKAAEVHVLHIRHPARKPPTPEEL
jgi:toxin ParE1/3/4